MRLRCQKLGLVLGTAVLVTLAAWPLGAQEPKKADVKPATPATSTTAGKVSDPTPRVPAYFGQIGLTKDQREAILKIQEKHLQQIGELQKQVAQIRSDMLAECDKVLTDTQKQMVETRRRAAAEKKKARVPTPDPAKTAAKPAG
jgi:TolA-binding protein